MSEKNTNLNFLTTQDIQRFWSKVDKHGPIVRPELGHCWIWVGGRETKSGYGIMQIMGNRARSTGVGLLAHRISQHRYNSPIPAGMCVLHHCDNPPCVNPKHLFLGTHADNVADRTAKGRSVKGSKMWKSIFTEEQVLVIRTRLANGERQADIAREMKTSRHTVYCIDHRITWKHI